jgi:hypothetical protein
VKPIRLNRLFAALSRVRSITPLRLDVLREAQSPRRALIFGQRARPHPPDPDREIGFLKAELKYVTVRTAEREYLLEESLAKLEQEFLGRFVRIHATAWCRKTRSAASTGKPKADGEGHWVVVLKNVAEKLAVSRRQQHIVREFGKTLCEGMLRRSARRCGAGRTAARTAAVRRARHPAGREPRAASRTSSISATSAAAARRASRRRARFGQARLRLHDALTTAFADVAAFRTKKSWKDVATREIRLHFLQGRLQQFSLSAEQQHYDAVIGYLRPAHTATRSRTSLRAQVRQPASSGRTSRRRSPLMRARTRVRQFRARVLCRCGESAKREGASLECR